MLVSTVLMLAVQALLEMSSFMFEQTAKVTPKFAFCHIYPNFNGLQLLCFGYFFLAEAASNK